MHNPRSLAGLVLAGGTSRRMGRDKANLRYDTSGLPQWKRAARLLAGVCDPICLSVRHGQELDDYHATDGRLLEDGAESAGPLSGLLAAFRFQSQTAWLVVACDLPLLDAAVIDHLVACRDGTTAVIAYRSVHDGLPEPLCAIYEPSFLSVLPTAFANDQRCPRKLLIQHAQQVRLLDLPHRAALENANTPDEYTRLVEQLAQTGS